MNCKYLYNEKYCNHSNYYCVHIAGESDTGIRTMSFSDNVYFAPWIGKNYEQGSVFGKRTLVLGNSHYCSRDENFKKYANQYPETKQCFDCSKCYKLHTPGCCYMTIENFTESDHQVPGKIVQLMTDSLLADNYNEIIKTFSFYNLVQESLPDGSKEPAKEQCIKSYDGFWEVLEVLRPELIISLGTSHMWDCDLPNDKWESNKPFNYKGREMRNGFYFLDDGTKIPIISIYHPSYPLFDAQYYNEAIHEFVKIDN